MKVVDFVFIGFFVGKDVDIVIKVVCKCNVIEFVGFIFFKNGKVSVVEYLEIDKVIVEVEDFK